VWNHDPGGFRPLTQTDRAPLRDAPQNWVDEQFFAIVTDLVGAPTELVGANGDIGWQTRASLWGSTVTESGSASCPIRFPGQYFDEESGLNYNFRRYYDPENGRYASNDPLGLTAGPNPQAYVHNPTGWIDPLGLAATSHCPDAQGRPRYSGTDKPWTTGAEPNSVYTHVDSSGRAVQNAIYDENGDVVGHVDFKQHGSAPPGHFHTFPEPGNPGSGHGPGAPHHDPSTQPPGWGDLPGGIQPRN